MATAPTPKQITLVKTVIFLLALVPFARPGSP